MNNTTCNQTMVVQEPEIQALRGKERLRGVGHSSYWQYDRFVAGW